MMEPVLFYYESPGRQIIENTVLTELFSYATIQTCFNKVM